VIQNNQPTGVYVAKNESQTTDKLYDDLTLESMGAHMFFGALDSETSHDACDFILKSNMFYKEKKPLTMFFNTAGGDSADGFAIIDLMETSRLPIATVGIGTICSMGVLLVSAGNHGMRALTRNSEVMAHQFSGYFDGKQHELIAQQTAYKMLERRFIRHFLNHSLMTEVQIRDVLFGPSDRYLTPAECKRYGLVDRVVEFADVSVAVLKEPTKKLVSRSRPSQS
jgi:ATP-dependent Clp protease, protease subunit